MKSYLSCFLALYLACSFSLPIVAQTTENPNRILYQFDSEIFNEERTVLVSLPSGYKSQPKQHFAVMYVFDAQFEPYFKATAEMLRFYSDLGDCIPMIVVGIPSTNRSKEFTPRYNYEDTYRGWRGNCGNADTLSAFLATEVFPLIEENYRTNGYRLGVGHSLGGTFLFQDILKAKPLFNGIIAASPNLSYDKRQLVDSATVYFSQSTTNSAFIFASCGTVGNMELDFNASLKLVDEVAKNNPQDKVHWHCKWMEGEDHMSNYLPSVNKGLLEFAQYWILDDKKLEAMISDTSKTLVAHISDFYASLSSFANSTILPSADELNTIGYSTLYNANPKLAETVINEAISKFPDDANLYDSRGEMQELQFNLYDARESYIEALAVLEKTKELYEETEYLYYQETFSSHKNKLTDDYINFKLWTKDAMMDVYNKKYKKASKLYKKAFALDFKSGTHQNRKTAVIAFVQTGDFDAAFEQLDLLANYFEWQGSETFEEEPRLNPLKNDSRWLPLMKKFEANAK